MKTIGFIDYFLDEWHANQYPKWIEEASGGSMKVAYAWGKIDSPNEDGLSNAEWCAKNGVQLLGSIEAVVAKSDYLIVLSPDHPEFHAELSDLPLKSGKPTYVDKTFAPDRETAVALFELARAHSTPMYSSSAMRFAAEYENAEREGIVSIASWGPGSFENYSIHQIEPIVSLMGSRPQRIMSIGTDANPAMLIGFDGGKQATLHHFGWDCPFRMAVGYETGKTLAIVPESDYFSMFIRRLIEFFETGKPKVEERQTVDIIALIEYGRKAAAAPYEWVELP
ncbi:hypothetical protein [Cohnella candidum]|uniref:Gfo/Idh/MocA family oxidoreductase n=1 Tax=Cohnella candidum TaxID=2674991 RepID=A0A3G3JVK1_9BACL|nr:hypothetical protein [Cohnella candidum]AYQ72270.1 hypothetical protein EAV92_06625 [Cohnella candidum]